MAISTNGLYWLTGTPNLGAEYSFRPHMTVAAGFNYNPFTYKNNRKMKHWLFEPEYRYWLSETFKGHYFGAHATVGGFNFGRLPIGALRDYRFEGGIYGAGITYGYQWILTSRLNLGINIGVGYFYLNYDKYYCQTCGDRIDHYHSNYFGPTKAAVSLIYLIKQAAAMRKLILIISLFMLSLIAIAHSVRRPAALVAARMRQTADTLKPASADSAPPLRPKEEKTLTTGNMLKRDAQTIYAELYCLQSLDSRLLLDMNIDMREVNLLPDCSIYFEPWLIGETDSVALPPIIVNGPKATACTCAAKHSKRKPLPTVASPTPSCDRPTTPSPT